MCRQSGRVDAVDVMRLCEFWEWFTVYGPFAGGGGDMEVWTLILRQ